jgi:hypothetical protein
MKPWIYFGAIVLVVALLTWGYLSGHCTLCQKVKDAIAEPAEPVTTAG